MSSFNKIYKKTYESSNDDVISLLEYIIFYDTEEDLKFIVFKFFNRCDHLLNEIDFTVCQHDANGDILVRSRLDYNKLNVSPNEAFTPEAKYKVDSRTESISVMINRAVFDCIVWENNQFTERKDYVYTDHSLERDKDLYDKLETKTLSQSRKLIEEKKYRLKELKSLVKYNKEINSELKRLNEGVNHLNVKKCYKRIRLDNKNQKGIFLKLYSILLLLIVILGSIGLQLYINMTSNVYQYAEFDYSLIDVNEYYDEDYTIDGYPCFGTCEVYKSYSNEGVVYVPSYSFKPGNMILGNFMIPGIPLDTRTYEVVGVHANAFEGDSCYEIVLPNKQMFIGASAFKNCQNLERINTDGIYNIGNEAFSGTRLTSFTGNQCTFVGDEAFSNCPQLTKITIPNAKVGKGVIKNSNNVNYLDVMSFTSEIKCIGDLFGCKNEEITQTITIMVRQQLDASFYEGLPSYVNVKNI